MKEASEWEKRTEGSSYSYGGGSRPRRERESHPYPVLPQILPLSGSGGDSPRGPASCFQHLSQGSGGRGASLPSLGASSAWPSAPG